MAVKSSENKKQEKDDGGKKGPSRGNGGGNGRGKGGGNGGGGIAGGNNVLSAILSAAGVGGETVSITPGAGGFGAVRPTTGSPNPNIRGDGWRVEDEEDDPLQNILDGILRGPEILNGVNMDIINDAIRNLPIPDLSGQRPPTQTGTPQPVTEPERPPTYPDETGRPTVGSGSVPSGGNGQVPDAPTGGSNDDIFDRILDIFRNPIFGGGNPSTPPFFPDTGGDMTFDDLLDLPIFGGGGQGGSSSSNASANNSIADLIGDISNNFDLSGLIGDLGDTVINAGLTDYAADKQLQANKDALDLNRYIYDSGVDRLEPFRQAGLSAFPQLQNAATGTPNIRNLFQGVNTAQAGNRALTNLDPNVSYDAPNITSTSGLPALQAGNRNVTLGDSSPVSVNNFNPYDANDPRLKHLIDTGTKAVENSAAARGNLFSGETLEALQEVGQNAALGRAAEIQGIESARDQSALASQGQSFGQTTTNAGLNNQLNQQDLQNSSGIRSQLFGEGTTQFGQGLGLAGLDLGAQGQQFRQGLQKNNLLNLLNQQDFSNSAYTGDTAFNRNLQANQFDLGLDQSQYGKLYDLARLGQNSAANQGAGGASFSAIGSNLLQNQGDIRTARTSGYTNALSGLI